MQHNHSVFVCGGKTLFQSVRQNIIITVTSEAPRSFIAGFGIHILYPVAHAFTPVIIVFPKNIISGNFDNIRQILRISRAGNLKLFTRAGRKQTRQRHRSWCAARRHVSKVDNILFFQQRVGFFIITIKRKVLRPRRFADNQQQNARLFVRFDKYRRSIQNNKRMTFLKAFTTIFINSKNIIKRIDHPANVCIIAPKRHILFKSQRRKSGKDDNYEYWPPETLEKLLFERSIGYLGKSSQQRRN